MDTPDPVTGLRRIPDNLPALMRPPGELPAEQARERFWNLAAILLVVAFALGAVGWWAYGKVRESLRDLRAAGLTSLLDAETKALSIWVDEKKRAAERWGASPGIQREAATLAALAAVARDPADVCRSPARRALLAQIAPFAVLEETVAINLVAPGGAVIASQHDEYCGLSVAGSEFARRIRPVFEGRTVFVRPFLETERIGSAREVPLRKPLVWVETPVRGPDGRVIAALGFGRYADAGFGALLLLDSSRSSREAYAFNRAGLMLTRSRYLGDLRAAGLAEAGDSGILKVPVRDPGGDVVQGYRSPAGAGAGPLTLIAQQALAATAADATPDGLLLEPYRNYRGASVIGAWRWLPEKEMFVVVEIEAGEAYAPLQYLEIAFGVLIGFLAASLLAALGSFLWAVRLSKREARRVGQYTLEREIGEGGISRVYLARHSHLKRPTAVKVLKRALATDEMVTRFEREVQLCSRLTHPNTIEIYDYGRTRDGTFYYAMEYLDGITLEDLVRRDGAMPVSRAVHALLQVCGSLREAHATGLVHRDIKPNNLMLCRRGGECDVVKVLDFGLVKELRNEHTRDITQFARVLGTPLYMAPERLRNPADADARSDVYAVGAVAYFLLSGRRLYETDSDHDLVYQVLNTPAPTLAAGGVADVPAALESLLARCLAKDRDARPPTIGAVAAILAEVARERPWREEDAREWWRRRADALGIGSAGEAPAAA